MGGAIRTALPNGDALRQGLTAASIASLLPLAHYDAVRNLPKTDIAWEFLRRNSEYRRQSVSPLKSALIRDEDWHGVPVFRQNRFCESAASWGLISVCDPDCPAPCDGVFWNSLLQDDAPQIMVCRRSGLSDLFLNRNPRLFMGVDGRMTLHLQCGNRALALSLSYASNDGPAQAGLLLPVDDRTSVTAALRLLRNLRPDRNPQAWTAQRLSLRDALIGFDASAAGLRYREIATLMVGPERVREEWRRDATALKDRVRRAVKRGYRLVQGGYRDLLLPSTTKTAAIASRTGADAARQSSGVSQDWGGSA